MSTFLRIIALAAVATSCVGFRTYGSKQQWAVSVSDTTIWLNFCETKTFDTNDLPAGDSLNGAALTFESVIDSVIDDFNSIESAYLTLADASRDPNYALTANASERTIQICYKEFSDLSGGRAELKVSGSRWTGCELNLRPGLNASAKDFIRTLTHELGHCMGLDHPQETEHAIMSYFVSNDIVRLQIDDKMGLTFLYPINESAAQEALTLGLSCSTK